MFCFCQASTVLVLCLGIASATYSKGYDAGYGIDAAVKSKHSVATYPVASSREVGKSPVVDINSGPLPLTLRFNSHSSQINAIQKHFGSPGTVQKSSSIDEPDLLIQNVKKPVIQEVREVITPYRHRTQEVRPVQEKIETIIAKGHEMGGYGGGKGYGYSGGHDSY